MTRRKMLWAALAAVPLAIGGGFAYANATKAAPITPDGFVCPVTGETLPCEKCCPLTTATADAEAEPVAEPKAEGYVCPLTGETLGCKGCCPLNQDK